MQTLASVVADGSTDPLSIITSTTSNYLPELLGIGALAIPIGGGMLLLKKGWRYFASFVGR